MRSAVLRRAALRLASTLLSAVLVAASASTVHANALPPEGPAIRGITIGPIESSQQQGRGYGTEYSAELLDELVRLGTNSISITPFGRIWDLSSTEILHDFEAPSADNRAAVSRMIRQAKERGLTVLLIPHLWVETGGWRGEIDPGSEAGWVAYQRSYRKFLLSWAKVAQESGADALSIGVECKSWSGRFGAYWHDLIREIRKTFDGKLTYSANWDEAEDVLFWDQLDFIGVNAFYPLADRDHASYAQYAAGASAALARVGELGRTLSMPVLFVEIGYTTRENAAVEPWLWPDGMQDVAIDEWEQARALTALIGASVPEAWFAGFYVWRYYANLDDVSQEAAWGFSPHGKLAEHVLRAVFGVQWGADPVREIWHHATPFTNARP
jgi:hypothetical protein